jgi:hypothetical protein
MLAPLAGANSDYQAVTSTSAELAGTTMVAAGLYVLTCDVDCYVKQGAAPTASAADGSMLVPAGMPLLIDGAQGAKLAVIRKGSADGVCTLQRMALVS